MVKLNYNGNENKSGIYVIFNKINWRVYIGQGLTFEARWDDHLKSLRGNRHGNSFLQADWKICGEEVYEFHILEIMEGSTKEERNQRENYWISVHYGKGKCYNFMKTANSLPRSCFSLTPEETAKIISDNMKKVWANPEHREKRLKTHRSPQFRKKQSEDRKIIIETLGENDPVKLGAIAAQQDLEKRKIRIEKLRKAALAQFGNKDYGWIINTITNEKIKLDNIKKFATIYSENCSSIHRAIKNNQTYFKHWKFERPDLIPETLEEYQSKRSKTGKEIFEKNPELRNIISEKIKQLWQNEDYRKNQSLKRKDKTYEEMYGIEKAASIKKKKSDTAKKLGTKPPSALGKKRSKETLKRMSDVRKGKPSPHKGKPLSEEHKRKIKESHILRVQKLKALNS